MHIPGPTMNGISPGKQESTDDGLRGTTDVVIIAHTGKKQRCRTDYFVRQCYCQIEKEGWCLMDYKQNVTMDPSGFVVLADFVPGIVQEIRYQSTYNFMGE